MNSDKKAKPRKKYKALRNSLSPAYRSSASRRIAHLFFKFLEKFKRTKTVGIYINTGSEVDTLLILNTLLSKGKNVAAPKSDKKKMSLVFHSIKHGLDDCRPGNYNIIEPQSGCPALPSKKIGLFLVPGIAFDEKGYRLGYGKGFYDKFLKSAASSTTVGLAYEKCFVKSLPHGAQDFPVQCVITEKRIHWAHCKK